MDRIKINSQLNIGYTLVPNEFIDHYMVISNGDFVKVYLFLIRLVSSNVNDFSIMKLADQLNLTESDIIRALKFWESKELLEFEMDNSSIKGIQFMPLTYIQEPVTISESATEIAITTKPKTPENNTIHLNLSTKPQYTMDELSTFMSETKYKQIIYITGRYLGKNLNQQDLGTLISFHDWLGLPLDVIELLVEYCASNNHRNMRYIERVAIDWADNGINTIEKAKIMSETFNKKYYTIKKALGSTNRTPVNFEIELMDKWINEYAFDMEIILEACDRTVKQTSNGSLKYTDKILFNWYKSNVHTFEDIAKLDKKHMANSSNKPAIPTPIQSHNKFINYNQRTYDFDQLEKKALEMRLKETKEGSY